MGKQHVAILAVPFDGFETDAQIEQALRDLVPNLNYAIQMIYASPEEGDGLTETARIYMQNLRKKQQALMAAMLPDAMALNAIVVAALQDADTDEEREKWSGMLETCRAFIESVAIKGKAMAEERSVMCKIEGSSFRCEDCGANVFTELPNHRYRCNGCNAVYVGFK